MGLELNPMKWSVCGQSLGELAFGSKGSSETTPTNLMTPEQLAKLKELLAQLQVGGSAGSAYGGQLTADPNAVQGASLAALEQSAMNAVTPGSEGDVSTKTLTEIMNAGPADIQASVVDPTMQNFIQEILPAISGRFSGMSGFGSDKMLQEGIAAGNVATGIASERAKALDTMQGRKIAAASALPTAQGGWLQNILNMQAGGGVAQATAQAPLTNTYNEFLRQQQLKQQLKQQDIDNILAALGLKSKENITTVTPGTTGLVQGFAQGVGSGLGKKLGGG